MSPTVFKSTSDREQCTARAMDAAELSPGISGALQMCVAALERLPGNQAEGEQTVQR